MSDSNVSKSTRKRKLQLIITVILCVFVSFASVLYFAAEWYIAVYGDIGFSAILYTMTNDLGGVQSGLIYSYLLSGLLPAIIFSAVACFLIFYNYKNAIFLKLFKKTICIYPFKRVATVWISVVLALCLMLSAAFKTGFFYYLNTSLQYTKIYDEKYVEPTADNLIFPENKPNLIYIYLESMETTYFSKDVGGALNYNLVPELYNLAKNNINFSHNNEVGGFRTIGSASWTMGSIVAQSSGIPMRIPLDVSKYKYGKDTFLSHSKNITDILSENGYTQMVMYGSKASFAGRDDYYNEHGVDYMMDLYTAREDGIVDSDYHNDWWGMEDKYVYEYAKKEITKLSKGDKPFSFITLTADTHHVDGYVCEKCDNKYSEQYENVISCASEQLYDFIVWLQAQPFYENTVIVIVGDHLSMSRRYFSRNVEEDYTRHVYNCIINSRAEPLNTKNRCFSALDMFPTTLAAMGCQINGGRLGLGTNLFSDVPTLAEEMGFDAFSAEILKRSRYYDFKYQNN